MNWITKGDLYFVEFFAHWCHWCKAFKGQFINFAKFIERYHFGDQNGYNIKIYAVDLEDKNDGGVVGLGQKYNISGYPTVLLFLESSTKYIKHNKGGSKYDLYRFFQAIIKNYSIPIKLATFPDEYCLNSIIGPKMMTDSKGWICPINFINQKTGCCDIWGNYDYYSICDTKRMCDDYFPCCIDYESCIACCLNKINPEFDGEIMETPFHTNDRKKLLNIQDTHFSNFTFCRSQCRTSSQSTFEGNVYVDYRKYFCYEKDIKSYEQADKLLKRVINDTMEIIIGKKGESCTYTCNDHDNYQCVGDNKLMSLINTCTTIENKFDGKCKGGCMFGYDEFLPAFGFGQSRCYLKATLAKHQWYSCDARDDDHQRLCLCNKKV